MAPPLCIFETFRQWTKKHICVGHWMDVRPDLKGGHRVEPVSTNLDLSPVPLKVQEKQSDSEDEPVRKEEEEEEEEESEQVVCDTTPIQPHSLILNGHEIIGFATVIQTAVPIQSFTTGAIASVHANNYNYQHYG